MANTTPTTPPSRIAPEWERDTSVSVLANELETERTTSPPTVSEPENVPVPQRVRAAPGKNPRFLRRARLLGLDADIPHHLPSPEIGDVNALQIRLEKYSAMFSMPVHDGASIVELPSADGAHTNGSYSDPAENIP
jgi:hypothetical protein